jgi:hypothetical protein
MALFAMRELCQPSAARGKPQREGKLATPSHNTSSPCLRFITVIGLLFARAPVDVAGMSAPWAWLAELLCILYGKHRDGLVLLLGLPS